MDNFQIIKEIGQGSFANVFKAINKETKEIVAIKRLKSQFQIYRKYTSLDDVLNLREIKFMRKINHPNIVKMKEIIREKDEVNLIFEYLESNLLEFYQNNQIQERDIKIIIFQCLQGLSFMHQKGYFHRDLKPENILIKTNSVKLCDFGLVREIRSRPPYTEYVSTRWYRAPEILLHSTNYNSPVDIFALGCIMAELYLRNPLLKGQTEIDQLNKTLQLMGTPQQNKWQDGYRLAVQLGFQLPQFEQKNLQILNSSVDGLQLITEMLQIDPNQRPSANQILAHNYFQEIKNSDMKLEIKPIQNKINNNYQTENILKPDFIQQKRQISYHQNNQIFDNQFFNQNGFFEQKTNRNAHKGQKDISIIKNYNQIANNMIRNNYNLK